MSTIYPFIECEWSPYLSGMQNSLKKKKKGLTYNEGDCSFKLVILKIHGKIFKAISLFFLFLQLWTIDCILSFFIYFLLSLFSPLSNLMGTSLKKVKSKWTYEWDILSFSSFWNLSFLTWFLCMYANVILKNCRKELNKTLVYQSSDC